MSSVTQQVRSGAGNPICSLAPDLLSHHLLSEGQPQTRWPGLWIPNSVNDVTGSSGNSGQPYGVARPLPGDVLVIPLVLFTM